MKVGEVKGLWTEIEEGPEEVEDTSAEEDAEKIEDNIDGVVDAEPVGDDKIDVSIA